jgi:hypothetical protein
MKKIHIVSCSPRSGTTLIAEAINACFNVDGYTAHETGLLKRQQSDVAIRLTRKPMDLLLVRPFLRFDPDMYVIAMMRDPRDVVVSRHAKVPDLYWTGLAQWHYSQQLMRELQEFDRFRVYRFEDLVTNPDDIQRQLMEWLPWLKRTEQFSEYHLHANVSKGSDVALRGVRPISPESVGAWIKHPGRIVQQIQLHGPITAELQHWGYESDADWEDLLEGIEPDTTQSYKPEFIDFARRWKLRRRYWRAVLVALFQGSFPHKRHSVAPAD